ncbi:hypothetical protein R69888_07010 [Paraburkholderia haematera]|uniref:Transposase n=1 Tax=Paraburkholderia haematera TaxID=2793077 RepID=A0ABM8SYJ9_9BURK|nr:hypothetical protein R69888_07010 [Paraburkholderia haematera]
MDDVTLVGIDLGKHSFHLHGQDANLTVSIKYSHQSDTW